MKERDVTGPSHWPQLMRMTMADAPDSKHPADNSVYVLCGASISWLTCLDQHVIKLEIKDIYSS